MTPEIRERASPPRSQRRRESRERRRRGDSTSGGKSAAGEVERRGVGGLSCNGSPPLGYAKARSHARQNHLHTHSPNGRVFRQERRGDRPRQRAARTVSPARGLPVGANEPDKVRREFRVRPRGELHKERDSERSGILALLRRAIRLYPRAQPARVGFGGGQTVHRRSPPARSDSVHLRIPNSQPPVLAIRQAEHARIRYRRDAARSARMSIRRLRALPVRIPDKPPHPRQARNRCARHEDGRRFLRRLADAPHVPRPRQNGACAGQKRLRQRTLARSRAGRLRTEVREPRRRPAPRAVGAGNEPETYRLHTKRQPQDKRRAAPKTALARVL